jgi:FixJ family two-component response regulator
MNVADALRLCDQLASNERAQTTPAIESPSLSKLSPREREIFELVALGRITAEMATHGDVPSAVEIRRRPQ